MKIKIKRKIKNIIKLFFIFRAILECQYYLIVSNLKQRPSNNLKKIRTAEYDVDLVLIKNSDRTFEHLCVLTKSLFVLINNEVFTVFKNSYNLNSFSMKHFKSLFNYYPEGGVLRMHIVTNLLSICLFFFCIFLFLIGLPEVYALDGNSIENKDTAGNFSWRWILGGAVLAGLFGLISYYNNGSTESLEKIVVSTPTILSSLQIDDIPDIYVQSRLGLSDFESIELQTKGFVIVDGPDIKVKRDQDLLDNPRGYLLDDPTELEAFKLKEEFLREQRFKNYRRNGGMFYRYFPPAGEYHDWLGPKKYWGRGFYYCNYGMHGNLHFCDNRPEAVEFGRRQLLEDSRIELQELLIKLPEQEKELAAATAKAQYDHNLAETKAKMFAGKRNIIAALTQKQANSSKAVLTALMEDFAKTNMRIQELESVIERTEVEAPLAKLIRQFKGISNSLAHDIAGAYGPKSEAIDFCQVVQTAEAVVESTAANEAEALRSKIEVYSTARDAFQRGGGKKILASMLADKFGGKASDYL